MRPPVLPRQTLASLPFAGFSPVVKEQGLPWLPKIPCPRRPISWGGIPATAIASSSRRRSAPPPPESCRRREGCAAWVQLEPPSSGLPIRMAHSSSGAGILRRRTIATCRKSSRRVYRTHQPSPSFPHQIAPAPTLSFFPMPTLPLTCRRQLDGFTTQRNRHGRNHT